MSLLLLLLFFGWKLLLCKLARYSTILISSIKRRGLLLVLRTNVKAAQINFHLLFLFSGSKLAAHFFISEALHSTFLLRKTDHFTELRCLSVVHIAAQITVIILFKSGLFFVQIWSWVGVKCGHDVVYAALSSLRLLLLWLLSRCKGVEKVRVCWS